LRHYDIIMSPERPKSEKVSLCSNKYSADNLGA